MLTGLGQNGTWSGPGAPNSSGADGVPPAQRRDLNHPCVPPAERGKPVALLPAGSKGVARRPERAAGTGRGSKRRPACNGPDRGGNITPPERGQTSLGFSVTREPWPTDSGSKAEKSAAARLAGAAPRQVHLLRRLQARIVQMAAGVRWRWVGDKAQLSVVHLWIEGGRKLLPRPAGGSRLSEGETVWAAHLDAEATGRRRAFSACRGEGSHRVLGGTFVRA
jgi:hypothetical protein